MPPQERLPDDAPFPVFFLPNFLGILFALGLEKLQLESKLSTISSAHPHAWLGLGLFGLANVNSFLAGKVVLARIRYGVKLPNLYANRSEHKDAVLFNCIQRGHQNFLEQLPQIALSTFFLTVAMNKPSTAGMLLCVIGLARILYAAGYASSDVRNRLAPNLVSQFCVAVGIGYAGLAGVTLLGVDLLNK